MAAELRLCYTDEFVAHIAGALADETPLSTEEFLNFVYQADWNDFTLKQRMNRLTDALVHFLPGPLETNAALLKKLLPKISLPDFQYSDMLCMFVPDYLCRTGLSRPDISLDALKALTALGTSSEFAIRPFIIKDTPTVMNWMLSLTTDENANVRRFASEGCRPRLPWATALPSFKEDPSLIFPILEALLQDGSLFVRKSVANNLNDIAKDNPDQVLNFAEKWIDQHPHTNWILKQGLRNLLKQGDRRALALFGAGPVKVKAVSLVLSSDRIERGQSLTFNVHATLDSPIPENLRLDYAIDFMKATGKHSRKVFRLSEGRPETAEIQVTKSYRFVDYTTRKHHPGLHRISLLANGQILDTKEFMLGS
ncbi:DNA alkylation repair protein [Sneathiella aquimaris]|uniref:DNA alkylation repair protein n=1 Tax=Sneathiella aquimaris TaxID=2599305 RepID=UPI00146D7CF0|nr:DNA alkylation repair protein [Sneathiella aquimaris]